MAQFTLTDLSNRAGEIVEAAYRGPVEISKRGKRKFVLMTAEDFDRMSAKPDQRRAVHVDDLTDEEAGALMAGLAEPGGSDG